MNEPKVPAQNVVLPSIGETSAPLLVALTDALGVSRDILATDDQIEHAWNNLPRLLSRIPPQMRDPGLVRMCVAVASGLFDSAINYAWNAAILELRERVRRFGLNIIPQITGKEFDEKKLLDQKDSELLDLCLRLNLISEHGFFMLNQCRDIRNNFSAAHPTIGDLDEDEFISFLNRVSRYALNEEQNLQAVDIQGLIKSIQAGSFSEEQFRVWCERIEGTFDAQREMIFGMLHGIYCDPDKNEETRVNSITICRRIQPTFTAAVESSLINRHQDYQAKGEADRYKASQAFFEHLGLLSLLSESERHAMISTACSQLMSVHDATDNFYNERPFAERLKSLTEQQAVPATTQGEFVETIVTCSVGNQYGTARSADIHYKEIIQGFSPREIQIMLALPTKQSIVANRIQFAPRCRKKFASIVSLLQEESVPTAAKAAYESWMKENSI